MAKGVYPRVGGATCASPPLLRALAGLSPRGRGNRSADTSIATRAGLSPRGRGNRSDADGGDKPPRSIPAWAGQPQRGVPKVI